MFQLHNDNKHLQIQNNEEKVMGGMQFQVTLNQSTCVDVNLVTKEIGEGINQFGKYSRYEYVSNDNNQFDFSFTLDCYEQFVHAFVDVTIHHERLFARNDYLSSENGVVIKVKTLGEFEGLMANYRHKDWWTRPHFNNDLSTLPDRTQSLLWKSKNSFYHLLPICASVFKADIRGAEQGFDIAISSYDGGRNRCQTPVFVLGKGDTPFELSKQITKEVIELRGESCAINEKRYPERLEHLGWCSWDAFYQEVNEEGILNKVKELKEKQVPVKWLMIDDGWSKTTNDRLTTFEPDPKKFPGGFKNLTNQVKNTYGVDSVGVWHTFAGYWGGIDPDSLLAKEMEPNIYKTNSEKLIPYPDSEKGYRFWDTWHTYLKKQGIDFVKVDGQSGINNFMMEQMSVGESSLESHKALEASVGIHFDHCMINCMGMASENIWNRPISAVSRSGDDFVPEDENGFAEHAIQNVYNSFYHGELYWGDWDMFWSKHKDAKRHALLRAVSGGPIYTSDAVGETVPEVIWPLIYQDGRILRCDQPGKPTADILLNDPTCDRVPLKVWNTSGEAGVIATFNVDLFGNEVEGTISPSDIEGASADEYFVYDYFKQKVEVMKMGERKPITLLQEECELFLFITKQSQLAPIGLIDKYISSSTFKTNYSSTESLSVQLKEGGKFAFVAETQPSLVTVNGQAVTVSRLNEEQPIYVVDCSSYEPAIVININK
ncbi:Sip1-related alpha-galactosidase [Halalkalibacter kiskunsagensis]|uniref:Sip1-related alpha-galactosidase n=1 Tax=Halalkalibacter kiskunsagensis TaxID=1548599 RepID=A0ABV6KJX2_9BACI